MSADTFAKAEESLPYPHTKSVIETAPGRELISAIVQHGSPDELIQFFAIRANWCGGSPLIHDHFWTYSVFDDLLCELNSDQRLALVQTAITNAETSSDEHFHPALLLLVELLPDDAIRPRPEGFSDSLIRFRDRAIALRDVPNLSSAWNTLATKQRCYQSKDDPLASHTAAELYI